MVLAHTIYFVHTGLQWLKCNWADAKYSGFNLHLWYYVMSDESN